VRVKLVRATEAEKAKSVELLKAKALAPASTPVAK
jgi:hypothetical protein